MSCSRGTCFSALSCRRAPTKSRLMSFVLLSQTVYRPPRRRKKTWGSPTSEAAVYVRRSIHRSTGTVEFGCRATGPQADRRLASEVPQTDLVSATRAPSCSSGPPHRPLTENGGQDAESGSLDGLLTRSALGRAPVGFP